MFYSLDELVSAFAEEFYTRDRILAFSSGVPDPGSSCSVGEAAKAANSSPLASRTHSVVINYVQDALARFVRLDEGCEFYETGSDRVLLS